MSATAPSLVAYLGKNSARDQLLCVHRGYG